MATTYTKVFEELTSHLNFTMNIVSQKLEYGMRNRQTLIWSGVMGEIVYNRADFAVADMALTSFRICFVDFTLPLIISKINLYFKEPGICGIKWIGYFQVISFINIQIISLAFYLVVITSKIIGEICLRRTTHFKSYFINFFFITPDKQCLILNKNI